LICTPQLSLLLTASILFHIQNAQAKILRAIESKAVDRLGGKKSIPLDIRVIAATNRNLEQLLAEEKFRPDLYFRLNVARVHLPSLRERKEERIVMLGRLSGRLLFPQTVCSSGKQANEHYRD